MNNVTNIETNFRQPNLEVAEFGDYSISYRISKQANKPQIVFLHGIGSNSASWDGQFTELSDDYNLLTWDAPGYGKSTCIADEWANAYDYSRRLKSLIDYVGFDKIILVGQSLGAIIATAFGILYPEIVAKLTLVCPATGYACQKGDILPSNVQSRINDLKELGAIEFGAKRYKNLLNDNASEHAKIVVETTMQSVNPEGYMRATHLLAQSNLRELVANLQFKPAIIYGKSDKIIKQEAVQALIDITKTTEVYALENGSHALAIEFYHEFNQILKKIVG